MPDRFVVANQCRSLCALAKELTTTSQTKPPADVLVQSACPLNPIGRSSSSAGDAVTGIGVGVGVGTVFGLGVGVSVGLGVGTNVGLGVGISTCVGVGVGAVCTAVVAVPQAAIRMLIRAIQRPMIIIFLCIAVDRFFVKVNSSRNVSCNIIILLFFERL